MEQQPEFATQIPKLRMNFFGLHTYPQGGVGPEPTVWIGLAEDVNPDGTVASRLHRARQRLRTLLEASHSPREGTQAPVHRIT